MSRFILSSYYLSEELKYDVFEHESSLRIRLIHVLVFMNGRLKHSVKFHPHALGRPAVSTVIV